MKDLKEKREYKQRQLKKIEEAKKKARESKGIYVVQDVSPAELDN